MNFMNLDLTKEFDYKLCLCRPYDRREIAYLTNITEFQYHQKLDEYGDLSFNVPLYIQDTKSGTNIINEDFDLIKDDFLISLTINDVIKQYYVIKNPEEEGADKQCKKVVAYAYEYSLDEELILNYNDTQDIDGILNKFVSCNPEWTVGYIDPIVRQEIGQSYNKYRSFSVQEKTWWQFIKDEIEKSFNCISIFDTDAITINVYDKDSFGTNKDLYTSNKNFLKKINKKVLNDRIITQLFCFGNNAMDFSNVNITGYNYIFDYSYYRTLDYMPQDLLDAFNTYDAKISSNLPTFNSLLSQVNTLQGSINTKNVELNALKVALDNIVSLKDKAIKSGEDLATYNNQINAQNILITTKNNEINTLNLQMTGLLNQKNTIVNSCKLESNFNTTQLKIINRYGLHTTFKDDTIADPTILLSSGNKQLSTLNTPQIDIKVEVADFLKQAEWQDNWNMSLGDVASIGYEKLNIDVMVNLIEFTHCPEQNSLSLTFSNRLYKQDPQLEMARLLKQSKNSSNIVQANKQVWNQAQSNTQAIDNMQNNPIDVIKQAIKSENDIVTINGHGIELLDFDDKNQLLRLLSSCLVFSSDGGETYTAAITGKGVNGGAIKIGSIQSSNGNFNIDLDNGTFDFKNNDGSMELNQNLLKFTHSDGSYSQFGIDGLKRYVGDTGKEYHYLMDTGHGEIRGSGTTGSFDVTVPLDPIYKNKNFKVIVPLCGWEVVPSGWKLRILNIWAIATDTVNGSFTFSIAGLLEDNSGNTSQNMSNLYINYSWMVIA